MEPEVVAFLKRVAMSIFLAFCWLAINVVVGIRFNLAFVENRVSAGNVIYYLWLVGSLVGMLFYFLRIWRQVPRF